MSPVLCAWYLQFGLSGPFDGPVAPSVVVPGFASVDVDPPSSKGKSAPSGPPPSEPEAGEPVSSEEESLEHALVASTQVAASPTTDGEGDEAHE